MAILGNFLKGIRVVDLSRHLPGPYATLLLADMGAEVIKIEPPSGDELRQIGPRAASGRSAYFEAVNAGKKTFRLNLREPGEREVLLRLVESADILIESFRPGVMARLGVGPEVLRPRNPKLIFCSLSGFGAEGPLVQRAGHDLNYLALAGLLAANGSVDRPIPYAPPIADMAGGLFTVIAVLGALACRARTGEGATLDLSLADAAMPLQLFELARLSIDGHAPKRECEMFNGGVAFYRVYRTGDEKFVTLGAVEPKFWRRFCEAAGRLDWIERHTEALPQNELIGELSAYFASMTVVEAQERFEPVDCCFAPVLDLGEAIDSPHHAARKLVRKGPDGILQALFPALVDGMPPDLRAPLVETEAAEISRAGDE